MIVMGDKAFNLAFQVTRWKVIFQQDAVLEGLMPALKGVRWQAYQ